MLLSTIITVVVGGILGQAIDAGYNGRLAQYINSPQSYAIQLFSPEMVAKGKGGWQGEHAGKWLYAASKAYERTGDPAVHERLTSVADYLISRQESDGYLGCYREDKRYYYRPGPEAMKVDWDTWIMAYLIKGFTEASVATGEAKYADCALHITEFLHWTVFEKGIKIAQTGMHSGMAGCGLLDPLCDLYAVRPVPVVREMIERCIYELDSTPCLQLITLAAKGYDVSLIGNGKIYEMIRCLTGLAKAYRLIAGGCPIGSGMTSPVIAGNNPVIAGNDRQSPGTLLAACTNAWESIRTAHLTTLGGPWGGINFCWELFNRPAEWAPYECTETCSVMQWLNFCWEMLQITGDGKYASEIEKTAYNALMAARAEDGLRWEYYVRTNGELTPRGDWACCWSSGMVALEDLPSYIYKVDGSTIFVNVICEGAFDGVVRGKAIRVEQVSDYACTGVAEYVIAGGLPVGAGNDGSMAGNDGSMAGNDGSADRHARPDRASPGTFTIAIHHPQWAESYAATINGAPVKTRIKNGYICIKRNWKAGDRLRIEFPYQIRTLEKAWEYRNAGKKEYNFSNWYNGFTRHYVTFSAGPLVFACDHADTFERPNSLVVSREDIAGARLEDNNLQVGPIVLRPIAMMPPFQTSNTEYRTTWLQIE